MPTGYVCGRHGIRSASSYKYQSQFGGLEVSDARGLRTLEQENARLKKPLADQMLDNAMLEEINAKSFTPDPRREAVAHLQGAFEVSPDWFWRRARSALSVDQTMARSVSCRPDDAKARARIRELASERRRFGYRRLHWLLCREGWVMNHKTFRRLYP